MLITHQTIEDLKRKNEELENEVRMLREQHVEVRRAKELYLKIFEEFPALIWRSGLDKMCDYFNKTWLDFTGRTLDQEYGNGWVGNVHPDDYEFCLRTYVDAFDLKEPFVMEYRMKHKSGEYRWIRDFGRPFYDLDSSFAGYIGSCYDITDTKNKEQQLEELNATKDRFFSIIAHDLRNPFQNLFGYAELLKTSFNRSDLRKIELLTEHLHISAKSAFELVENLLIWANSQTGRIIFQPESIEIKQFAKNILSQCYVLSTEKKINVQFNYEPEDHVYADKNMLATILRNLITNAIKFSYRNSLVSVKITENTGHWLFIVEDSGIGITEENISNLFRIDKHLSTQGTQNEKGSGLGLILCREFVEKHKGRIWAESKQGQGSRFCFTICKTLT